VNGQPRGLRLVGAPLLLFSFAVTACILRAPTERAAATSVPDEAARLPWVATWACGLQLTEPSNNPPAPGLANNTLRQVALASIGGGRLRLRLSNRYGNGPVTLRAVHVARSTGAGAIDVATDRALTFAGKPEITIPAGRAAASDPLDFALDPLTGLAVTIAFGGTPPAITGHPGARATSYLMGGKRVSPSIAAAPPGTITAPHWYYLAGLDVLADAQTASVAILGDSLTDGRGSTTDGDDRWPNDLSRRLHANAATSKVAVLNLGLGGNAVVDGGLGPPAIERFSSDVLEQPGLRWLVVLEGVNDIGRTGDPAVANQLIAAYGHFIDLAHARGVRVYGVPILPFGGSFYDSAAHQTARQTVNAWIRTSGRFDAVIDLDAAVRDPAHPERLRVAFDTGDQLHLNPAGYQAMADAIDLALFEGPR
jgi:lysophospholipase L1-like esterase